jgi:hypothetical protein
MSLDIDEATNNRTEFADRASCLLRDFSIKLSELATQLKERRQVNEAIEWFKGIQAHAEELARQVSAEIEAGRATGIEKVDLALRLADFEYFLGLCAKRSGLPEAPRVGAWRLS